MTPVEPTLINDRWTLLLPAHRAGRIEWPVWEKERLAAMYDVIARRPDPGILEPRPNHVVFDIGTEEGDFPALWASWGADVVLVEPNPKVWPNVRVIFEANHLVDRVRGWFVGFSGDDAVARMPSESWMEHASVVNGWPRCAWGEVIGDHGFLALPERPDVPCTTIDTLAAVHGDPTVITIDVEGAELTVLRGARAVLTEAKPAVFVSVHMDLPWIDEKYPGDTGDKVRDYMESFGYEGRWLATDHEEHWEWRHPNGR